MIFTGTAAELAELTRKFWGAEWWPKNQMHFVPAASEERPNGVWEWPDVWYQRGHSLEIESAASIIFAAAIHHIITRNIRPYPKGGEVFRLYSCGDHFHCENQEHSQSPLHAVLAAVEACK